MHDVFRRVVDLALHLHRLLLFIGHLHPQDAEIGPPQIQSNEVSPLCHTHIVLPIIQQ